ncbi:peptide deformylase [Lentibacillus halophilus]|uniref:Peptide deformylase n=1 Tax=Lentibacillus halophilus TaxID=295065 RepID=A0ABP3J9A2_9BACI
MITMDDIVREGHPALRKQTQEVTVPPSEEDQQLLKDMLTFIQNSQDEELADKYQLRAGVGLAAPQLGVSKRLCAVHFEDFKGVIHSYQLVNPRIVSHSVEKAYLSSGEGCLSVDRDVEGYVPRYARITVKASDMEGNEYKLRLRNFAAIVVQHEIDHLDGIMFYDYIHPEDPFSVPDQAKAID